MSEEFLQEAEQIFVRWLERAIQVLSGEIDRLDVKDTRALKESLQFRLFRQAAEVLGGEISFLLYGRFVDMGAGRKRQVDAFSEREDLGKRRKLTARKPVKWYSPAFFGLINDLQGALGFQLMEQVLSDIKQGINGTQNG
ncbi:MAG: hypothetical protein ACPGJS_00665 [Flammeovirgaceae bacterium]